MIGALIGMVAVVFVLRRGYRDGLVMPRFLGWLGKAVLATSWMMATDEAGFIGFAVLAPVMIPLLAPTMTLRRLVVPLGRPRLAYWAARLSAPTELINDSGLGAVYGVLALARKPSPQPAGDWLAARIDGARFPRGPGVVAAGLLAARRKDRDAARGLFGFADALPNRLIRSNVRLIARDWLVADAAHQGDWHAVARRGRRGRHSLRWSYCVARLAERLSGAAHPCPDTLLWLCWIVAPRRRATLPLLRRALGAPQGPAAPLAGAARLPDALANLAHLLEHRAAHDRTSLARILGEIDAVLGGPATQALLERRLLDLGAQTVPTSVGAGVRDRLAEILGPLIEAAPRFGSLDPDCAVLRDATERVRARWFKDIEARCKDYQRRSAAGTALGIIAEWEAWAALQNTADRLMALAPASNETLFQAMHVPVNNFAVFQHNTLKRRMLAHSMYSWLAQHCRSDASASQLIARNIKASRI